MSSFEFPSLHIVLHPVSQTARPDSAHRLIIDQVVFISYQANLHTQRPHFKMTKFQRGELMEGWNDCPVPMASPNSSSSSLGTPKPRKRVSRLPGIQTSQDSSPAAPPRVSAGAPPMSRRQAESKEEAAETEVAVEVDVDGTEQTLRDLLEASSLAQKDKDFFTKRLVEPFAGLDPQHKHFIAQIVGGLKKESATKLKAQVLNYMMVNSGVSTWGVPLKKLVETMGQ